MLRARLEALPFEMIPENGLVLLFVPAKFNAIEPVVVPPLTFPAMPTNPLELLLANVYVPFEIGLAASRTRGAKTYVLKSSKLSVSLLIEPPLVSKRGLPVSKGVPM